jgi:hypothetical protein
MASYFYDSCAEFVEIDHDGRYILNFLQGEYLKHFPNFQVLVTSTVAFLKREYERFKSKGHVSETAARIAHKYKMALDFVESHVPENHSDKHRQ